MRQRPSLLHHQPHRNRVMAAASMHASGPLPARAHPPSGNFRNPSRHLSCSCLVFSSGGTPRLDHEYAAHGNSCSEFVQAPEYRGTAPLGEAKRPQRSAGEHAKAVVNRRGEAPDARRRAQRGDGHAGRVAPAGRLPRSQAVTLLRRGCQPLTRCHSTPTEMNFCAWMLPAL